MPLTTELMAQGMPAAQADALGTQPIVHVVAAGASQGAAPLLVSTHTILDTGAAAGVRLPPASNQDIYCIYNNSGNAQNIYPAVGETINASTANTAYVATAAKCVLLMPSGNGWFANVSA